MTVFGVGGTELLIVGFIAWMLFGKRLPQMVRNLGTSVVELKKGFLTDEDDRRERPA